MNGAAGVHRPPWTPNYTLLSAGDISGQPAASQPSARPPFRDEPSAEAMRMNIRERPRALCGKLGRPAWERVSEAEYEHSLHILPVFVIVTAVFSLSLSVVPELLEGSCRSRPKRRMRFPAIRANSLILVLILTRILFTQSTVYLVTLPPDQKKIGRTVECRSPRTNRFSIFTDGEPWRVRGEGQVPDVTARVRARRRRSCRLSFVRRGDA